MIFNLSVFFAPISYNTRYYLQRQLKKLAYIRVHPKNITFHFRSQVKIKWDWDTNNGCKSRKMTTEAIGSVTGSYELTYRSGTTSRQKKFFITFVVLPRLKIIGAIGLLSLWTRSKITQGTYCGYISLIELSNAGYISFHWNFN